MAQTQSKFGFTSMAHALATVARDTAKSFRYVAKEAPVLEPVVEGVTAVLDPPALVAERAAFSVLGTVLAQIQQASTDTQAAVAAKGLTVTLDQATIADLKDLLETCEGVLVSLGVLKAPSAPAAPATKQ